MAMLAMATPPSTTPTLPGLESQLPDIKALSLDSGERGLLRLMPPMLLPPMLPMLPMVPTAMASLVLPATPLAPPLLPDLPRDSPSEERGLLMLMPPMASPPMLPMPPMPMAMV